MTGFRDCLVFKADASSSIRVNLECGCQGKSVMQYIYFWAESTNAPASQAIAPSIGSNHYLKQLQKKLDRQEISRQSR